MRRLTGVLSGRRSKWLILGVWVLIAVGAVPLAGKLESVQESGITAFLPADAESTQVIDLQRQFLHPEGDMLPAVVVYERTAGITPADQQKVVADAKRIAALDAVPDDQVSPPMPSPDGQSLQIIVPVSVAEGQRAISDDVNQLRGITGGVPGLDAHVAGPAALTADVNDMAKTFDAKLLTGTVAVVVIILLLTYRSPFLWLIPLAAAGIALQSAQGVIYLLARYADLSVTDQSASILLVLVFGACTTYALLLLGRYREELRRHADRHEAMAVALHRVLPPIAASAAALILSMLCLYAGELNSTMTLGPVAAVGVGVGVLALLTLLPALLVIVGRWAFWPGRPRVGSATPSTHKGGWARVGRAVTRHPRLTWMSTAAVLAALAVGITNLGVGAVKDSDWFIDKPDSVVAGEVMARHMPPGSGQPIEVVGKADTAAQVAAVVKNAPGIAGVNPPTVAGGYFHLEGMLRAAPDSAAAFNTVDWIRSAVRQLPGDVKVGGATAMALDTRRAAVQERNLIIPLVLVMLFVIAVLLLRALVAALLLIATLMLSYGAALGVSSLVFHHVFDFPGVDTSFPLWVFVFLVALGVDYNIFLLSRVREESQAEGARRGTVLGLAATGGAITAAGLVLAGTFAILAALPLLFIVELAFAIAFGVLFDRIVVMPALVTALAADVGRWMWWPSRMATAGHAPAPQAPALEPVGRQPAPVPVPALRGGHPDPATTPASP